MGDVRESIDALVRSRQLFEQAGRADEAAESTISLAASVAMSGDVEGAVSMLDEIDSSDPLVIAHASVQMAGIIARRGDFDAALDLYAGAEQTLKDASDHRWLALMHSTRGLVKTFMGDFAGAESDLETARSLFDSLGRESSAAEMVHNLGFVAVQRGDIARGLSILLDAERMLERVGEPTEATLVDRARAYMFAGLPKPAYESAHVAAEQLRIQGRELELTEALQQAAEAALAARDLHQAIDAAETAARLAAAQDRPGWHSQARLVSEEASWRMGNPSKPDTLSSLADQLLETHNRSGAALALAIGSLIHVENGATNEASAFADRAEKLRGADVGIQPDLLVSLAGARIRLADGDGDGARRILEGASDRVDASRATLAATEARAGISRLAEEIADLGVQVLHDAGESIVDWSERFRAASLRIASVVAEHGTEQDDVLASLRSTMQEIEGLKREGEDPTALLGAARAMESRVRELAMARTGAGAIVTAADRGNIEGSLDRRLMIYLYQARNELYGELIGPRHGTLELGPIGKTRTLADHLNASLRRSFMYPTADMASRTAAMLRELGVHIFGELEAFKGEVAIVPPPDLAALPWNALAKSAAPGFSVVVTPSASSWLRSTRATVSSDGMVVVAGPRLDHAEAEAIAVANMQAGPTAVFTGEDASVGAVLEAMKAASQLHLVAHTRLRHDNPMFSALELADGFLSLYDLEGAGAVPSRVMLSACESGHENVIGGYEMFGLTTLLLGSGASSILATVAPIPDGDSSIVAVRRIYRQLGEGTSAATALREAIRLPDGNSVDPSVAFVAYGA
jgi:tetratricopeptide (TPR) repeat protein